MDHRLFFDVKINVTPFSCFLFVCLFVFPHLLGVKTVETCSVLRKRIYDSLSSFICLNIKSIFFRAQHVVRRGDLKKPPGL